MISSRPGIRYICEARFEGTRPYAKMFSSVELGRHSLRCHLPEEIQILNMTRAIFRIRGLECDRSSLADSIVLRSDEVSGIRPQSQSVECGAPRALSLG